MFSGKLLKFCFRINSVNVRFASNLLLGSFSLQNSIFSKLIPSGPATLSSAFQTPLGAVRTHRNKRRLRPISFRYKPKDFPVDKKIPINYVFRVMPTPLSHPGDHNKNLGFIDTTKPKVFFEDSKELQTADEDVKRLFSLAMSSRKEILDSKYEEMREKIQRHHLDNFSHEVDIGSLTITIRDRYEKYSTQPTNKHNKNMLHSAIRCRNKLLNKLYRLDEQRYEWLLNVLELDHEKPKLGIIIDKPTRKTEIQRLTEEYCENIRSKKIEAYKQQLKDKQTAFLEEKARALELIEKEEKLIEEKNKKFKMEEELWWQNKSVRRQK